MDLIFRSGIWKGCFFKNDKNVIDLYKAFYGLRDLGYIVSFDPPPYGLIIKLHGGSITLHSTGSFLVVGNIDVKKMAASLDLLFNHLKKLKYIQNRR